MVKKKKLYKGKAFDISLYSFSIRRKMVKQEIIEQRNAAAILAIDNDKVIMVKQFRYPHKDVLEIPAGIINKNETSEECAKREFLEETGYIAKKMTHLMTIYPSLGYNLQFVDCYVATGLKKIRDLKLDKEEFISVVKMDFKKLLRMIKTGKIVESRTICAALTYAVKKKLF